MRVHRIDRARLLPHDMAFNPSICRHEGKVLMAYRLEDRKSASWSQIALCELDDDWQPYPASNRLLPIPRPTTGTDLFEDPRLYSVNGRLVMTFIAARLYHARHVAAQGLCLLSDDGMRVVPESVRYPVYGNNNNFAVSGNRLAMVGEKNWTLLPGGEADKAPTFLYTINPTTVVRGVMVTHKSKALVKWDFGRISGSTPLIPWHDKLLGCFHSFTSIKGGHRRYVAGWYLIDPSNWRLVGLSREPILVGATDEDDLRPPGSKWIPEAVFPCGLIETEEGAAVSYGWLDSTCRIAFFDRSEIEANLAPVTRWHVEKEIIHNPWGGLPGGYHCRVNGIDLRASSWPALLREARSKGVTEPQLHDAICPRLPDFYKRKTWAEE